MRKVRDYDAELKALENRAKAIKARRIEQLGQLVTATGADALDMKRSPARCSMPSRPRMQKRRRRGA
jgi:hypothetical protein